MVRRCGFRPTKAYCYWASDHKRRTHSRDWDIGPCEAKSGLFPNTGMFERTASFLSIGTFSSVTTEHDLNSRRYKWNHSTTHIETFPLQSYIVYTSNSIGKPRIAVSSFFCSSHLRSQPAFSWLVRHSGLRWTHSISHKVRSLHTKR